MPTEITKPATIKSYLKEHTSQRISTELIPAMLLFFTHIFLFEVFVPPKTVNVQND